MRGPSLWLRALSVVAAAWAIAACGSRETQLVVVTYADNGVLSQIDRIEYVVRGPDGMSVDASESLAGADAPSPPFTLGLYPAGSALGPVTVTVIGLAGTTEIVSRTARTSFVEGESRILRMDLVSSCIGTTCPTEETCTETGCEGIDVPAASLPEWEGTLPPPPDGGRPATDGGGMDGAMPPIDGGGFDGGMPPMDGGRPLDAPMSDSGGVDSGPRDAGRPDGGSDGGLCDPGHLLLPLSGVLDLEDQLDGASLTFNRPGTSSCPTTPSFADYRYETYTFCNPGPRRSFDFSEYGSLMGYTLYDPWIVVYGGESIPADPGDWWDPLESTCRHASLSIL